VAHTIPHERTMAARAYAEEIAKINAILDAKKAARGLSGQTRAAFGVPAQEEPVPGGTDPRSFRLLL